MYPLSLLGNGSVKRYRCNEYTLNNRGIVTSVVFYAVRVVSKERRSSTLPRNSCYLWLSNSTILHDVLLYVPMSLQRRKPPHCVAIRFVAIATAWPCTLCYYSDCTLEQFTPTHISVWAARGSIMQTDHDCQIRSSAPINKIIGWTGMNPRHCNNRFSHYLNVNACSELMITPQWVLWLISHVLLLYLSAMFCEIFLLRGHQVPIPAIRKNNPIREYVVSMF
jgi:hypothetical protein